MILGSFCAHLIDQLYPGRSRNDKMFREGCYNVTETSLTTKEDDGDIQFDCIFCLSMYKEKDGKGKVYYRKTVAVEIKTTAGDICQSSVDKYLGATPYFFIAVPRDLLPTVIFQYRNHPKRKFIGLIDSDLEQIVVMPEQMPYNINRQNNVLAHCYTSVHRYSIYNDIEPFAKASVTQFPEGAFFILVDGLNVNVKYSDYFKP